MITPHTQNGLGVGDVDYKARVIARAAFSRGHVAQFDLGNTDPDVTNNIPGDANSGFCNVITPRTGAAACCLGGVFLDDVVDNGKQFLMFVGTAYVYVKKASGSITKGEALGMVNGQKYLASEADLVAGDRFVAEALEAITTPTTATLCKCRINLVNGLGVKAA